VDHLQRLADVPAVAEALDRSRSAVDRLLGHRFLRTDAAAATVAIGERAARAGALLDGEDLLGPALTLHAESASLATTWTTAPRQSLARMHALAADAGDPDVGRPREDPEVSMRMAALFEGLVGTSAPAVVVSGVVHAEVLALRPFGSRDGLVARAAARAVLVSSGYDPRVLLAFETGWTPTSYAASVADYTDEAQGGGVVGWLVGWCDALIAATKTGISVCDELRAERG
jgi:hypothetical protein